MNKPIRELPPLRIKLLGDNSNFKKSLKDAEKAALGLQKSLSGVATGGRSSGGKSPLEKLVSDALKAKRSIQDLDRVVEQARRTQRGLGGLDELVAGAQRNKAKNRKESYRRESKINKAYRDEIKQLDAKAALQTKAAQTEYDLMSQADRERAKEVEKSRKAREKQAKEMQAEDDRALRRQRQREQRRGRRERAAEAAEQRTQERLQRSVDRALRRRERMVARYGETGLWMREHPRMNRLMGHGGDMGNRADIFMHLGAIRGIIGGSKSFFDAAASYETMGVKMATFAGGPAKGAAMMSQLQEQALQSPYSLKGLGGAAQQMMAYGMSPEKAVQVTKQLGDVAGGSNEKLDLLSYAMAQVTAMGKLQGQELRQLTEHGFNPLQTIARVTGKSYAELDDKKKKGLITSQAVLAALQIETEAGGRFWRVQEKLVNTYEGLVQQIKEYIEIIQRELLSAMEGELKYALRSAIRYLQDFTKWIRTHELEVAQWGHFIKNLVVNLVALHAALLAIASVRWIWGLTGSFVMNLVGGMSLAQVGALGVAAAIGGISYALYHATANTRLFNQEMIRSKMLDNKLENRMRAEQEDFMMGLVGAKPDEYMGALSQRRQFLAGQLTGKQNQIDQQNKAIQERTAVGAKFGFLGSVFMSEYHSEVKVMKEQRASLEAERTLIADQMSEIDRLSAKGPGKVFDFDKLISPDKPKEDKSAKKLKTLQEQYQKALDAAHRQDSRNMIASPAAASIFQGTAEASTQRWQHAQRMFARSRGGVEGAQDKQDIANRILAKIEQNTREKGSLNVMPANVNGATP